MHMFTCSQTVPIFNQCVHLNFSQKGCFLTAIEGAFQNSNNMLTLEVYRARAKEKVGNLTCCKEGFMSFKWAPKNEEESVRLAASIGVSTLPLAIL